jgi:hypothetical protein
MTDFLRFFTFFNTLLSRDSSGSISPRFQWRH